MNLDLKNVYIYTASELFGVTSSRLFQTLCTWYLVQSLGKEEILADLLFIFWTVNSCFLLVSGVIIEKFDKKKLLVTVSTINILISIVFFLLWATVHSESIVITYLSIVGIIYSAIASVFMPMAVSVLPDITKEKKYVEHGIKLKSSSFLLTLIIGPVLGGYLISSFGPTSIIAASILISALSLVCSLSLSLKHKTVAKKRENVLEQIFKGLNLILKINEERTIGVISIFTNIMFVPFVFLIIPVKVIAIGHTITQVATLELFIGIGMLVSSLYLISLLEKFISRYYIAVFGILLLFGSTFTFSLVSNVYLLYLLSVPIGMGLSMFNVVINSRRAISIPNGFRGYMESSLLFVCTVSIPIGMYGHKIMLTSFNVDQVITYASITVVPILVSILFSSKLKKLLNSTQENYYFQRYPYLFKCEVNYEIPAK